MADPALGSDDYKQLFGMLTSSDDSTRAQGAALSKKLTPDEQQQFFEFQKAQHPQGEVGRADNSVLGVPPELAVLPVLGLAKAAYAAGPTVSKAGPIVRAALTQAGSMVKYEATKSGLQYLGVPQPLATIAGAVASGYKSGSLASAAETPDKLAFSASDVLKIKRLVEQGVPQQTAIDTVLKLTRAAAGSLAAAGTH